MRSINDEFRLIEQECLCVVCAYASDVKFAACEDNGWNCSDCTVDECPCHVCHDCDKFEWRGIWRDPVNDPPKGFAPVIVCREKAKGEYVVEQGHKDIGDWWKVYGTRIKAKSVVGWQEFPAPVRRNNNAEKS